MSWPRDEAKLSRVQALMAERELDALVVRAPDNVLYLTDYWCMKGYDLAVFPREGKSALVVLEPQADEAGQSRAGDIKHIGGYDAGPGWDACTGWGSPDGPKLMQALGG